MKKLFFELIQVAIGNRACLSHTPLVDEWGELYAMAKKQSLVGVCFAGVQKLKAQEQCPPEMLYLKWMGMAAKIQQRNELLNKKGEELLAQLKGAGMEACILKGQSLAALYSLNPPLSSLNLLRQSGDIDIWVRNRSIEELDAYVKGLGYVPKTTAAHVSYEDTSTGSAQVVEIELHAVPAFMRNFRTNRKLVQWLENFNGSKEDFNLVYLMVHMYHHVLFEGLGLRQLMDYHFVLRAANNKVSEVSRFQEIETLRSFGMIRFARGVMWIMKDVFKLEDKHLLCEADAKVGKLLLDEVMKGGNFGHHDEGIKALHHESALVRGLSSLKRNIRFFRLGPAEIICSPLWSLWHWWWRKKRNF